MSNQKGKIEDLKDLESWMKSLADQVRAMADAPKYILPLIFYKRLNDVYEDEFEKVSQTITDREVAKRVARMGGVVRFTIPDEARFEEIRKTTQNLGEKLTQALRSIVKENPKLQGVIDIADYNETSAGQRIISDHQISRLIEIIAQKRLGLNDVEPDLLGRAYEYLLRIYAEGSGKSAGEFYTPRTVTYLMAYLLDPEEGQEVYDPACGSGGLLIKCALVLKEKLGEELKRPLRLYGQERNHLTYAISKMNLFLHDLEGEILMGDTFSSPRFLEKRELRRFDLVVANPMWNQDDYDERFYQRDKYNRFTFGFSPSNSADWGWIQHMLASLNQKGKMGVVLDTGAVSRGGREKAIRQKFVEKDLIESIVLLPENLFYNTGAPGIIMIINKSKPKERKGKIMLINASQEYEKGKPKNYLEEKNIKKIKGLIRERTKIGEIKPLPIYKIDENIIEKVKEEKASEPLKVIKLTKSITAYIEKNKAEESYLVSLKEMVERILEEFRNQIIEAKVALEKLSRLAWDASQAKRVQTDLGLSLSEFTIYWMLKQFGVEGTKLVNLAKDLTKELKEYSFWMDNPEQERNLRLQFFAIFQRYGQGEKMFEVVGKILNNLRRIKHEG